ncbi:glycine oxidase ThiO [Nitrosospira sp. Is2]|uniref:glycine oxidase ThiO n=1 Tax=Nitrosospira sp. Is2 TaxID=3080532 RepID=UPI00295441F9|nr:glycine oxidase ThiO [Nitrosospira sp. Is2]WON75230.1 glycine oxidase ThiO [Nitrosospira sp. Is2]
MSDVLIIGGGIAGLTTAHELLRQGATVTLLERDRCGQESSWAGAGILSPLLPWDYPDPVTLLTRLSNRLFPAFIDALRTETAIDPEYQASGMLVLNGQSGEAEARLEKARLHAAEVWCARFGFSMNRVRSHKIAPALSRDEPALWLPDVCQVRNPRLLQALIRAVELRKGDIVEHTEVARWNIAQGRIQSVGTSQGKEYAATNYLVTAGAWSRRLLREHALNLDIWPVRGQILLFKGQPGLLNAIVLQEPDKFYLIPRRDGFVLAGSTLEDVGFDKCPTAEAHEMLLAKARALVPELSPEMVAAHWAGLRPGSPGNVPVIDRHPVISNLYLNSGHYRYGVTMATGSARLLSNILSSRPQPIDATPYRWPA